MRCCKWCCRSNFFYFCAGILFSLIISSILNLIIPWEADNIGSLKFGNVTRMDPFIFVGGVPRSGTTLMRAILDTHASIRCGEETRVIPRILGLQKSWRKSDKELLRLEEAKISEGVIDTAVSAFIMHIMIGHGPAAERICNKDPLVLKYSVYLSKLFPNSKFLLMVRDGRATVHSIISRKVTITGFDLDDYRQCLMKWNIAISIMHEQCLEVGESRCMMVYYEQLVLHPRKEMERILKFLDLPWKDSVLHHQDFIGSAISLSKVEKSTDQVIKPINTDALTSWYGHIPENVARDISVIAPMLKTLGYDTSSNRPNYGNADQMVIDNTANLHNSNINSGRPMSDNLNPKISLFR